METRDNRAPPIEPPFQRNRGSRTFAAFRSACIGELRVCDVDWCGRSDVTGHSVTGCRDLDSCQCLR